MNAGPRATSSSVSARPRASAPLEVRQVRELPHEGGVESNKHQNPELQPAYEEEKWTVLMKIDDESTPLHIQYGYAFNWALTAVLPGSAYVLPGTHTERIFSSIVMIAGALMNAFVFGNVAALIQRFDHLQAQYSSLLDQLKAFSSHHRFPKDLNDRMRPTYRGRHKGEPERPTASYADNLGN